MFDSSSRIHQMLSAVAAGDGKALPAGIRSALCHAIDSLRSAGAPQEDIELAEKIFVTVHLLESCLIAGDSSGEREQRERLGTLIELWRTRHVSADRQPKPALRIRAFSARLIEQPRHRASQGPDIQIELR